MSKGTTRKPRLIPTLPYCFVIMPFGRKTDPLTGSRIDFDQIYTEALVPAINRAGLRAYRDDGLAHGGPVTKGIYEALMLCRFAVVDLTLENGNVFYELGIRHAVRPSSTLAIAARPDLVPFDVGQLRMIRYVLNRHSSVSQEAAADLSTKVTAELQAVQRSSENADYADSPLFQVITDWRPITPSSLKTDLFRDQTKSEHKIRRRLRECERLALTGELTRARDRLSKLRARLGDPTKIDDPVLVELMLTMRALEQWSSMIKLAQQMPARVRQRALVQEQLAAALNRSVELDGSTSADLVRREAIDVLTALVDEGRGSSETWGLIGRVHKDRWRYTPSPERRDHHLTEAIEAYRRGFQLDSTDTYPGTNIVTMLYIRGTADSLREMAQLLPVVEFAARRLIVLQRPTYWMHAALMECAVLRDDPDDVDLHFAAMADTMDAIWQPVTTRKNIDDIISARGQRAENPSWLRNLAVRVSDLRPPEQMLQ